MFGKTFLETTIFPILFGATSEEEITYFNFNKLCTQGYNTEDESGYGFIHKYLT